MYFRKEKSIACWSKESSMREVRSRVLEHLVSNKSDGEHFHRRAVTEPEVVSQVSAAKVLLYKVGRRLMRK